MMKIENASFIKRDSICSKKKLFRYFDFSKNKIQNSIMISSFRYIIFAFNIQKNYNILPSLNVLIMI